MHLRQFRLALVLTSVAALAACAGTTGTVEGTETETASTTSDSTSTSGTGDDSVSGAATATDDTSGADPAAADSFEGHPLDNPASALGARTIYFEFDASDVPESERATIEAHARYLSEHAGASIILEGHADERGSREYNIALGERRADAVRQLMTLLGAADPQIRAISYGEERPASDGHDESAWQLNRRVEIVYRSRE